MVEMSSLLIVLGRGVANVIINEVYSFKVVGNYEGILWLIFGGGGEHNE